jgi:UDP-N-acetylglucosamine--N-acetylmuramyl-(pentapeptide) pyrophosphoryl-undecaprenol N-acetylglucosamine transferase
MTRVLIAGGGTGGHVFPMVAVADALQAERDGVEVVFVGTGRGIETRVIPERGGQLELLDVLPLRGHGLGGFVRGALRAMTILPRARALVKRIEPHVVFSVGGYAAGPVTLAARSMGIPVTLLEPNAVWGFTNKLLKPLVQRVYGGFPDTVIGIRDGRGMWTGAPLRSRFEPVAYRPRDEVSLLIMGGSQGALALNDVVPRAIARCLAIAPPHHAIEIVHQTGKEKDASVRARYRELGIDAEVVTFIEDVAAAIAAADIVIERAGASSCGELCAIGRASILVPYPFAADDHQRHNAESLAKSGAAIAIRQSDATIERVASELAKLTSSAELRSAMADRARERGRPDAAQTIARDLLALAAGYETPLPPPLAGHRRVQREDPLPGPPPKGEGASRTRLPANAEVAP